MSLDNWINPRRPSEHKLDKKVDEEKYVKEEKNTDDKNIVGILLSSDYDPEERKAYLKFYDINRHKIINWYDITDHHPYAFSRENPEYIRNNPAIIRKIDRVIDIVEVDKLDPLADKKIKVSKIIVKDPLVIGGTRDSLREHMTLWEADIKYYANYIFDMNFEVGGYYLIKDMNSLPERIHLKTPPEIEKYINDEKLDPDMREWLIKLSEEVPRYKRIALDIEVYNPRGLMPQAENPEYPIFMVSLYSSDGLKKVLVYDIRKELRKEDVEKLPFEVEILDNEVDLIKRAIDIISDYPIVITFNGDNFDLPYLRRRGERLGISDISSKIRLGRNDARVTWGIHIDLYRFFKNVSIKNYAFSGSYDVISLDSVARALIGKGKEERMEYFQDMPMINILRYSFTDAEITYELTAFNRDLVMRLITIIARIANMTIDDVCRLSVSNWIKNRLIHLHRKKNYLIPLPDEIKKKGEKRHFQPVTKGKKYVGAIVIPPKPGVHFNVHVVDFASLYPSIMKEHNISYETVNCPHIECKDNLVPKTTTWICKKRRGIISEFVGIIRDIRVKVFKKLSKDENLDSDKRSFYNVIQGALKVFINAIYGVTGAETFPFYYLPAAEAVTLLGRHAIKRAVDRASELGLEVIYGDTDSLFIKNPDLDKINELIKDIERELKLKLEIDKVYKYVALSRRKKNYFGVLSDGTVDVKGLVGKKSSTPPFIKNVFYTIIEILKNVDNEEKFKDAVGEINKIIKDAEEKLLKKKVPPEDLAISVTLSKPVDKYIKTTPQHVKAARKLERRLGIHLQAGSIIKLVKTIDKDGATPLELIKSPNEINSEKYIEILHSTLEQILDVLNIEVEEIKKEIEIKRLDEFFNI